MTATPDTTPATAHTVFRVVLEVDIGDRPREAFLAAWQRMAAAAAQEAANLSQSLSVDAERPSTFYILSDWTDRDEFRRFSTSPHHDEHVTDLKAMGRTVSMTQMLQVLTGPAVAAESGGTP